MTNSNQYADISTLRDLLCTGAERYGDRPALGSVSGLTLTYSSLHDSARACAERLIDAGVAPGDRVALLSENRPEWGAWYLAITAMGATVVPILTDFHEREVRRILDHSTPRAVAVSDRLTALLGEWKAGDRVPIEVPATGQARGNPFAGPRDPADIAAIIYTSGTTGNPKGVMLSHRNIISNAVAAVDIPHIKPEDRMLSILPLAHTYECTIGFVVPLLAGASVSYLDGPPVISRLLPALAEVRPTMMLSVPLIMEKLYRSRVAPIFEKLPGRVGRFAPVRVLLHRVAAARVKRMFGGRIRFFGIGGAPLAPDAERFLKEGGFPYAIGYGLTETAPLLAGADPRHTRFRATGPPLRGVTLRLAPAASIRPASGDHRTSGRNPDVIGEIQARGPNVMQGYYRNPDATADAFTEDGWFRTGDLGSIDRRGYLRIRGRSKTMILGSSGENIYPEEIEAAIDANALVEESLVLQVGGKIVARVRLNVEEIGKRVGALASSVDLQPLGRQAGAILEELRQQINAGLNRFSRIGGMILQVDPFERTPTRKIKRYLYENDAPGSPA